MGAILTPPVPNVDERAWVPGTYEQDAVVLHNGVWWQSVYPENTGEPGVVATWNPIPPDRGLLKFSKTETGDPLVACRLKSKEDSGNMVDILYSSTSFDGSVRVLDFTGYYVSLSDYGFLFSYFPNLQAFHFPELPDDITITYSCTIVNNPQLQTIGNLSSLFGQSAAPDVMGWFFYGNRLSASVLQTIVEGCVGLEVSGKYLSIADQTSNGGDYPNWQTYEGLATLVNTYSWTCNYDLPSSPDAWDEETTYAQNDFVSEDGDYYISKLDNNLGNVPSESPDEWFCIYPLGGS